MSSTPAANVPPAFPFAASTINDTRPNTIVLKKQGGQHQEYLSSDTHDLYPGLISALQSDGTLKRHSVPGGKGLVYAIKEQALAGQWFFDPMVLNDRVPIHIAEPGEELLLILGASAAAVNEGDKLMSCGDGTIMVNPGLPYTDVAASTAVVNTVTETSFGKTFSIPANFLQVGDRIHIKAQGIATATHSTDTLQIKVYIGATVLAATAVLDVANSDIFVVDVTLVIRTNGASGTLIAEGFANIGPPASATVKSVSLGSTAIDTTTAQVVDVKATWSVADPGNSVRLDALSIDMENRPLTSLVEALEAVDNSSNEVSFVYIKTRVL